jgi:hypothetical protein
MGVENWLGPASGLAVGGDFGLGAYDRYNQNRQFASSHDLANDIAKKGVRWRVRDLEAAGLNPMLAIMNGGMGAANSGSGPGPIGRSDDNYAAKVLALASAKKLKAETAKVNVERQHLENTLPVSDFEGSKGKIKGTLLTEALGWIANSAQWIGESINEGRKIRTAEQQRHDQARQRHTNQTSVPFEDELRTPREAWAYKDVHVTGTNWKRTWVDKQGNKIGSKEFRKRR